MQILKVSEAVKKYGDIQALDQVSFQAEAGSILGLLGPNGSGKSTLMRSIVTLDRLDQGSIEVAGIRVEEDPAAARRAIGYAGQEQAIDKVLTGREFLRFQAGLVHLNRKQIPARVEEMLRRLDLLEAADRPCEGYSGGMRRRLDLAASLMHQPKLLILDEPSAGLDLVARRRLWDLLAELKAEGTTLLLATHDFEEADALCDQVVLMSRGRVADCGTPQKLRSDLGSWILSAALHEHAQDGDHEKLAALFEGVPGKALPVHPQKADFSFALASSEGDSPGAGQSWIDRIQAQAGQQQLPLFSMAMHRPTLQDVYAAAVGEAAE